MRHAGTVFRIRAASFTFLGLITVAALSPRPASAQAAAPAPPPPVREATAEFAFVGTSGNTSTSTIGTNGEFIYRPSPWETRTRVTYVRTKAASQLSAQALTFAQRVQRSFTERLAGFGQYGYQRDRFAGIVNRNMVEAGLAYLVLPGPASRLTADAGVGYANEQRVTGLDRSSATVGAGALYTLKVSETGVVTEEARYLLALDDRSDWRYTNTAAVAAALNSVLSLKVSNVVRFLNLPAPGFKSTDTITSVAVVAKF